MALGGGACSTPGKERQGASQSQPWDTSFAVPGGEDAGPSTPPAQGSLPSRRHSVRKPNDEGEFPDDAEMMPTPKEGFFYFEHEHVKLHAKPGVKAKEILDALTDFLRLFRGGVLSQGDGLDEVAPIRIKYRKADVDTAGQCQVEAIGFRGIDHSSFTASFWEKKSENGEEGRVFVIELETNESDSAVLYLIYRLMCQDLAGPSFKDRWTVEPNLDLSRLPMQGGIMADGFAPHAEVAARVFISQDHPSEGVQALARIAEQPRMAADQEQRKHFNCAAVHSSIKALLKRCELLSVGWPLARILWAIKDMDEAQAFMKDIQQELYEKSQSDEVDLPVRLLLRRVIRKDKEEILGNQAAFEVNS